MAFKVINCDQTLFLTHFKQGVIQLGNDWVKVVRILLADKLNTFYKQTSLKDLTQDLEIMQLV